MTGVLDEMTRVDVDGVGSVARTLQHGRAIETVPNGGPSDPDGLVEEVAHRKRKFAGPADRPQIILSHSAGGVGRRTFDCPAADTTCRWRIGYTPSREEQALPGPGEPTSDLFRGPVTVLGEKKVYVRAVEDPYVVGGLADVDVGA